MKTFKICTLFLSVVIFAIGCMTQFNIIKENPKSVNLSSYNSIYVGWLDLGPNLYGHKPAEWITENRRNNVDGLQIYLKDALPGKKIIGAMSPADMYAGNADLQLQFKLNGKIKFENVFVKVCELPVEITYIDGKTGRVLYASTVMATCVAPFPRNWKAQSFDGALDNDILNLANGIAAKIKSGK
jgi:hypothetical protein